MTDLRGVRSHVVVVCTDLMRPVGKSFLIDYPCLEYSDPIALGVVLRVILPKMVRILPQPIQTLKGSRFINPSSLFHDHSAVVVAGQCWVSNFVPF